MNLDQLRARRVQRYNQQNQQICTNCQTLFQCSHFFCQRCNSQTCPICDDFVVRVSLDENITTINEDLMQRVTRVMSEFNIVYELVNDLIQDQEQNQDFQDVKVVLTTDQFNDVQEPCKQADDACFICLNQELKTPTKLKKCNHIFCYDCIKRWLTEFSVKCPVCKLDLRE